MSVVLRALLVVMSAGVTGIAGASEAPLSGTWDASVAYPDGSSAARMTIADENGLITGTTGALDINGNWPLSIKGKSNAKAVQLDFYAGPTRMGSVGLSYDPNTRALRGSGTLYGTPVTMDLESPPSATGGPRTHSYRPDRYQLYYSSRIAPVLTINPGDTIRTTTLDNEGQDENLVQRALPGNTLTGPFYVRGAMPGDTLAVKINRIELNRPSGKMWGSSLNARAVQNTAVASPDPPLDRTWEIDTQRGVARLATPPPALKELILPTDPMIGSIGVAPSSNLSYSAGDLGWHGGNLDYKRLTAGTTIYLPVWQRGALLSFGDGHAFQADGEIGGQGLETSLALDLTVDLIKARTITQIWSEDADYIMVSGIDNSMDDAFKMATSGMFEWLKKRYMMNDAEVSTLMSAAISYDIAEVVDSRPHIVAKMRKSILSGIPSRP